VDINRAWETISDNINTSTKETLGYYKLKKQTLWFDERFSKLLDQRKQAKLQWLENTSEINGENLNNKAREASIHFRNKGRNI
jgi:hypothetical protein